MYVGAEIKDEYCNGFFGRRWDLSGSIIEAEGYDWILIRVQNSERSVEVAKFKDNTQKQIYLKDWI